MIDSDVSAFCLQETETLSVLRMFIVQLSSNSRTMRLILFQPKVVLMLF